MTEIHTYKCDICGKTFDFEDDCRKHEMEHSASLFKNGVVIMDSDGEILPLDNIYAAIDRSYAIYVGCDEIAKILWEVFDEEGFFIPIADIDVPIQYPAFFIYDQNNYRWLYMRTLEEKHNRLLELKTTAENALLN